MSECVQPQVEGAEHYSQVPQQTTTTTDGKVMRENVLKRVETFGLVLLFSRVLLTYRAAHTQRIEIC